MTDDCAAPTAFSTTSLDPLAIARWLVEERQISVIPLQPKSKIPCAKWTALQRRLPTREDLEAWFATGHDRNIGIVCGEVSRLVVIDCDLPAAVAYANQHLPATPMRTRTAKGEHRFYRHSGEHVRNAVRVGTRDSSVLLDVRADGGYVVAPGSVHETGFVDQRVGEWPPIDTLPVFDRAWLVGERHQMGLSEGLVKNQFQRLRTGSRTARPVDPDSGSRPIGRNRYRNRSDLDFSSKDSTLVNPELQRFIGTVVIPALLERWLRENAERKVD